MVPFSLLVLHYREVGIHRGRKWGFRDVFGFRTLKELPFCTLAGKVKQAYEGKEVPSHVGWPAQRQAIGWLVDQGRESIYRLDEGGILIKPTAYQRYYISDGHHRALALYVLGDSEVRARIKH